MSAASQEAYTYGSELRYPGNFMIEPSSWKRIYDLIESIACFFEESPAWIFVKQPTVAFFVVSPVSATHKAGL
jgi:hypothetical protein